MPTVTVHFGGICTFFRPELHHELQGFGRAVLVNAEHEKEVAGHDIAPHRAEVQIGNGPLVPVHGLHMRLFSPNDESQTVFTGGWPDLTQLLFEHQLRLLSRPSHKVVFDGDPAAAALYFDFKGGTLQATTNEQKSVVTKLVLQGDEVVLETAPFVGAAPSPFLPKVFREDTTIWVSNEDVSIQTASINDFYLHYLTAENVPPDPPLPDPSLRDHLPVFRYLPHKFGSIGAGCSNSTYP